MAEEQNSEQNERCKKILMQNIFTLPSIRDICDALLGVETFACITLAKDFENFDPEEMMVDYIHNLEMFTLAIEQSIKAVQHELDEDNTLTCYVPEFINSLEALLIVANEGRKADNSETLRGFLSVVADGIWWAICVLENADYGRSMPKIPKCHPDINAEIQKKDIEDEE